MVVDDHPAIRAGLRAMLAPEADLCVVAEAGNGAEALQAWQQCAPDLALIDLRMPVMDGFEALRQIRQLSPAARLVVMTSMTGDEDVYTALQAGAHGYLLKDCGREELLLCLRTALRGQRYLQAGAASSLAARVTLAALTVREGDVLQGLAAGHSNKGIARQLGMAEGTVKTHLKAVLSKLGARSRTDAVRLALQRGLVQLAEDAGPLDPHPGTPAYAAAGPVVKGRE